MNAPQRDELDLQRLGPALWRQRYWVVGTTIVALLVTVVITLLQRPVYESEVRIHLAGEKPAFSMLTEMIPRGLGPIAGFGSGDIQTDLNVLRSRLIAEAVVDSLALQVRLQRPRVARDSVLRVISAPRTEEKGTFQLEHAGAGSYSVRATEETRLEFPARVEIGHPFRIGESTLVLEPALRLAPPDELRIAIVPFRRTVAEAQRNLHVSHPDPGAQIVAIRFRSGDRALAAAVPNVATERFIQYKNQVKQTESRHSIAFLQEQAVSYQQELRAAEARLQRFREQARIVEPTTQAEEQIRRLASMQVSRDKIQAERESLRRLLGRIEANPGPDAEGRSPYRQLVSFPSFLTNGAVQNILEALTTLENGRSELLARRTERNLDVQRVEQRIAELELELYQVARSYLDALDNQATSLDANLVQFDTQLEAIPAVEVEYMRLLREQKLLDEVYLLIQSKLKEAEIQAAAEPANIHVVDAALVPLVPASPRRKVNLLAGLVIGLVLGTGAALVRQYMDPRVYTREDVQSSTAGLPVLGLIPQIGAAPATNGNGRAPVGWRRGRALPPAAAPGARHPLVAQADPAHPASEAYRALRTSLTFLDATRTPQLLLLTSAAAADGKSTSAANLAITLAQQGKRTLLIDGDLRRGKLHALFGLPRGPGLVEVLGSRVAIREAIHEVSVGDSGVPLHLLCSGETTSNPAELLSSAPMQQLLADAREVYEMIIVDAPPLGMIADAVILAAAADAVLLVARAGGTDRRALQLAARQLRDVGTPLSGVVLNGVEGGFEARYTGITGRLAG